MIMSSIRAVTERERMKANDEDPLLVPAREALIEPDPPAEVDGTGVPELPPVDPALDELLPDEPPPELKLCTSFFHK